MFAVIALLKIRLNILKVYLQLRVFVFNFVCNCLISDIQYIHYI